MNDTLQNAILETLKSIQTKLLEHDKRFDHLEEVILRQGRDSAGALMMMRATAGDFEQRIAEVRHRIETLDRGDFGPTGGLREP